VSERIVKERDIIRRLREAFGEWGIGDDAAVLAPPEGELLFASDAVVEDVHFRREYATPGQAVQKVITSNVSDIYAMGGVPRAILVSAGLPGGCGEPDIEDIIRGASLACEVYGVRLVGGDTVRSPGGYFFDVSIVGSVERGCVIRRTGARPGDALVLFGTCGGALAGLVILELLYHHKGREVRRGESVVRGDAVSTAAAIIERLVPVDSGACDIVKNIIPSLSLSTTADDIERLWNGNGPGREAVLLLELARRHIVPRAHPLDRTLCAVRPLPADAQSSNPSPPAGDPGAGGTPHVAAMIDISDGLARDLTTLCAESRVGAVVEEERLPLHPALSGMLESERSAAGGEGDSSGGAVSRSPSDFTGLAISSGEEYVMLGAVRGLAAGAEPAGGTVIGWIVERGDGITLITRDGERAAFPAAGYEHLF
jgi:thiamine monophosphate kinase